MLATCVTFSCKGCGLVRKVVEVPPFDEKYFHPGAPATEKIVAAVLARHAELSPTCDIDKHEARIHFRRGDLVNRPKQKEQASG